MEEKEFYRQLSQFKRLLVKEKQALIKNENQKVADLLPQKEKYLPSLQNYAGPLGEQTKLLLREILLTKQALSFGENLMKSIRTNLKADQANVYQDQKRKNPYQQRPTNSYIIDSQA